MLQAVELEMQRCPSSAGTQMLPSEAPGARSGAARLGVCPPGIWFSFGPILPCCVPISSAVIRMLTVFPCLSIAYNLILDFSKAQSLDCLRVREGFNLGL